MAELDKPYILLVVKKISNIREMLPILDGEALATLVVNNIRGILKVAAVKAPGFGDRRKAMPQIEEATSDYDKEKLQERVAKRSGGVALIRALKALGKTFEITIRGNRSYDILEKLVYLRGAQCRSQNGVTASPFDCPRPSSRRLD